MKIVEFAAMMRELCEREKCLRSAWKRGVLFMADELLYDRLNRDTLQEQVELLHSINSFDDLEKLLLNGAENWKEYSYGGSAEICDTVIAIKLCTKSELKRTQWGLKRPNKRENWLDVQARALYQANELIRDVYNCCVKQSA